MTVKTYKGWEIHKQTVGSCGWNVRGPADSAHPNGFLRTGFRSLAAAREFITDQVDMAETIRAAGEA
jgi:hypothetical protein